jgi:hypothetical protein
VHPLRDDDAAGHHDHEPGRLDYDNEHGVRSGDGQVHYDNDDGARDDGGQLHARAVRHVYEG